jgi:hypothetical protein
MYHPDNIHTDGVELRMRDNVVLIVKPCCRAASNMVTAKCSILSSERER